MELEMLDGDGRLKFGVNYDVDSNAYKHFSNVWVNVPNAKKRTHVSFIERVARRESHTKKGNWIYKCAILSAVQAEHTISSAVCRRLPIWFYFNYVTRVLSLSIESMLYTWCECDSVCFSFVLSNRPHVVYCACFIQQYIYFIRREKKHLETYKRRAISCKFSVSVESPFRLVERKKNTVTEFRYVSFIIVAAKNSPTSNQPTTTTKFVIIFSSHQKHHLFIWCVCDKSVWICVTKRTNFETIWHVLCIKLEKKTLISFLFAPEIK